MGEALRVVPEAARVAGTDGRLLLLRARGGRPDVGEANRDDCADDDSSGDAGQDILVAEVTHGLGVLVAWVRFMVARGVQESAKTMRGIQERRRR